MRPHVPTYALIQEIQIRAAHVVFHRAPHGVPLDKTLARWPTLVDTVDSLTARGIETRTFIAGHHAESAERNGSRYELVVDGPVAVHLRRPALLRRLQAWDPDVVHVHGLGYPVECFWLARACRCPVVVQDHANGVPRGWRRAVHRQGLAAARAFVFTSREQAQPFVTAGVVRNGSAIFEVLEGSSKFAPLPKASCRELTGVYGKPAVLWVGHLNQNKDPLTVLKGFEMAVQQLPEAHLWFCYLDNELERVVEVVVSESDSLEGRVHLVGAVPHEAMNHYYSAADIFVSGSHVEGSGYSLVEALACGLIPVVTDIPSFRRITREGSVGGLFAPGDASELAKALISFAASKVDDVERVRAHFEKHLSWDVIGSELESVYRSVVEKN